MMKRSVVGIKTIMFGAVLMLSVNILGCDLIKEQAALLGSIEKRFQKESTSETEEAPKAQYKTINESSTLKVIAVWAHEDLRAIGQMLAEEAKDKQLYEVLIYDDENEARNYTIRYDKNISKEDAAYEDNEEHLIAVYRKNRSAGENYIEIYKDIGHEDVEIIKF